MRHSSKKYLEKVLRRKAGRAISDYRMISAGDRVLVAVSGGRDSLVMMKVLALLRKVAPVDFDIVPVHVRTGYETGFDRIEDWIGQTLGYETVVYDSLISQILETTCDKDKSPCALCSRLRRGALYGLAEERGGSSIALGHHMDDVIETFFLRCLYTGQLGAMAPARVTDDRRNRIIRPLAYCTSDLIGAYFPYLEVEPVTLRCPRRSDSRREFIRGCIKRLERDIPCMKHSIFASLGNIDTTSLCMKENVHADPD